MALAATAVVGVVLAKAETKMVDGRAQQIVSLVRRGRAFDAPVVNRCLWVGVPAGLVGGGIGYLAGGGVNLGVAFAGALVLGGMSAGWREDWDDRYGRAGANSQSVDTLLHGLVGGLMAAAAATALAKQHREYPQRIKPRD